MKYIWFGRNRSAKLLVTSLFLFGTIIFYQNCSSNFEAVDISSSGTLASPYITFVNEIPSLINTSDLTATFQVSNFTSVSCQLNERAAQDCSSMTISYSNLIDGDYTLTIQANNNIATTSHKKVFRKDATPPVINVSMTPALLTDTPSANFVFAVSDNLSGVERIECSLDNVTFTSCASPSNLTNLVPGAHNLRIRASDNAKNMSQIYSYSWTIDLTAPTVTLSQMPLAVTNSVAATFGFTGALAYECQIDNGNYVACTSPKMYSALTAGNHTFRVRGTSAGGNVSAVAQYLWTIDNIAPTVPQIVSTVMPMSQLNTASFNFSSTDAESGILGYRCSFDDAAYSGCASPKAYNALAEGSHSFKVKAIDNAGNESGVGIYNFAVAIPTPPPTPTPTPPPPGSAPAWFVNAPTAEWTTIAAQGTISRVLPNPIPDAHPADRPGGITDAWTGGAVDQIRGEYILAGNGGHADYPGNEGYALSLRAANPAWRRLSDPTPNDRLGDVTTQGNGLYTDGRPRAMHSTFACFGDGRVWYALQNSVTSNDGGSANGLVAYNRDKLGEALSPLAWTSANLGPWEIYNPPFPSGTYLGTMIFGVSVFDRVNHKIWALGGNGANNTVYWSVDTTGPTLGQVTRYQLNQSFGNWGNWAVIAHDLRILIAGDDYRKIITVLDLNNPGSVGSWQQVSNVVGTPYFGRGSGGVYVAANNTIAIGHPKVLDKSFYKLRIPTKEVNGKKVYDPAGQWAWNQLNPPGLAMNVPQGGNDAFSKWNLIEDMGNGQSAIVILNEIAKPTYVYKIPIGGL